jgi:DNA-binding response OmpR family regulator
VLLGGVEVALRPREFDLLTRLARDAGQVVTRETLMHDVWDEHWWGSTKTLDVHLNAIRRKLGEQPGEPSRITAIRGVGYRLEIRSPEG